MARLALLSPLRERDYRLLWIGMAVSMIGDGIMLVAAAWLVYDISGSPGSLAAVSTCWSIGLVGCLLLGGVAADRVERRRLMIAADSVRAAAVVGIGTLALTGVAQIWQIAALAFVYGCAEAFFTPAFGALIPQVVPQQHLVQANSLQELARPLALRLAGPAIGGLLVGALGPGTAYLVDAGTFAIGIACVAAISPQALPPRGPRTRVREELREGLAFVRTQPWLWATLLAAVVSLLCFIGPVEVLLPYVIKHELDASASAYGIVLALAGVGNIAGGLTMGQRGMPRRAMLVMYLAWGVGLLPIAGYALAVSVWQLALLAFTFGVGMSVGVVIWATLMQTRVPPELMGRVTSLDWMVSFALTPVSFAMCGPLAAWLGAGGTLLLAGVGGAIGTLGIYALIPALRSDRYEPRDVVGEAGVAHVGGVHPDDLDALARG